MKSMKILLAGGTGQVGNFIARKFHAQGHKVVVLSRRPSDTPWQTLHWNGKDVGKWKEELDGADVVANLAGRSVNCRYNNKSRREILESRVNSTKAIGEAIAGSQSPPKLWINAGTATIYPHSHDSANDENSSLDPGNSGPSSWKFSTDVALAWEKAMEQWDLPHTRKVKARLAMVMGAGKGGVFDVFTSLAKKGLGGTLGNGRQFVSWIHELDCFRAMEWLIGCEELEGSVNICSPNPLPNKDFMSALRNASGVKFGLPATNWMLEIGAFFIKTETELLLKSRRVVPGRLQESGFEFKYPNWKDAATEIHSRLAKGGSQQSTARNH